MSKNLVIVESPTKAKTLTKILSDTKVLSTKGHFLELNDKWLTAEQRKDGWPVQGVDTVSYTHLTLPTTPYV